MASDEILMELITKIPKIPIGVNQSFFFNGPGYTNIKATKPYKTPNPIQAGPTKTPGVPTIFINGPSFITS